MEAKDRDVMAANVVNPISAGPRAETPESGSELVFAAGTGRLNQPVDYRNFLHSFWQLICAKNPLYLLSALLLLYAQTVIFRTDDLSTDNVVPVLILAGYTVMMTAAAIFIVRFGKVWDDARSMMLLLLLLFMVISVGCDGLILNSPATGRYWLAGGLFLTLGLSEGLARGVRLRISSRFRLVYYLLNLLFFLYPWLLERLVTVYEKNPIPAIRGMMLFPVMAGAIYLLLLPTVRVAAAAFWRPAEDRPWSEGQISAAVFGILGLGVICRTYLLGISFYGGKGIGPYTRLESGFGFYMLLPYLLVGAVLLLEYVMHAPSRRAWYAALLLPAVMPLLGMQVPNTAAGMVFLSALPGHFRPVSAALLLTAGYYCYAWIRGLRGAAVMFHLSLLGMAVAQIGFNCFDRLPGAGWSLGVVFVLLLAVQAILRHSSLLFVLTGLVAVLAAVPVYHNTVFSAQFGVIPAHLLLAVIYLGGLLFDDRYAAEMRLLGSWGMLLFLCGAIVLRLCRPEVLNFWWYVTYAVSLLLLTAGGWWFGDYRYRRVLFAMFGTIALTGMGLLHCLFARLNLPGGTVLFWSLLTFAAAVAISCYKGGVFRRIGNAVNR